MDDRDIVAVARWQIPYTLSAEQQVEKEKSQKATPAKPTGYNTKLDEEFSKALDERQEKWVDDSKDYGTFRLLSHTPSNFSFVIGTKPLTTKTTISPPRSRRITHPSAARPRLSADPRWSGEGRWSGR